MQPNYPAGYGQYAQPAPSNVPPNYGGYVVPNAPQFQPPQYAPQQQPTAAPQPIATSLPEGDFSDPSRGGELSPKIRHMVGRTVIILPKRIDENAKGMPQPGQEAQTRPCLYADVIVVDGGPIVFGNEINAGRETKPNTHMVNAPYFVRNLMINNTWIVNSCRDALPPLGNGLMLGVIEEGTQGNRPYLLTTVDKHVDASDRHDGAQRRQAAQQLYAAIRAGQFTNPTPTPLTPQPGSTYQSQQPQAQYGGPVQPGQWAGGPYPTATPAQYSQVAPPIQPQTTSMVNAVSAVPAPQPQSAPPAAMSVSLPPGFDVTQCPPGWDAGAWQAFAGNPQQATAIWQNVFAQQQHAAPASAPPMPQGQPGAPAPW